MWVQEEGVSLCLRNLLVQHLFLLLHVLSEGGSGKGRREGEKRKGGRGKGRREEERRVI